MARKPRAKSHDEDGIPNDDFTPSEEAFMGEAEPSMPTGYKLGTIIANTGDLDSDAEEQREQMGVVDVSEYEEVSDNLADRTRRRLESTIRSEDEDAVNTSDQDDFLDGMDFDSDNLPAEYE